MGQILGPDKIGSLSENAGVITLQPSVLTIGGKQFVTGTLNVAQPSYSWPADANKLHFIYAVVSGGVVSLVIEDESRPNSIGPSGFLVWKLVGAYYTDGGPADLTSSPSTGRTPEFSTFINIEGEPTFKGFVTSFFEISATTVTPTKATTRVYDEVLWKRRGSQNFVFYRYRQDSGGAFGSGEYLFRMPTNLLCRNTSFNVRSDSGASLGPIPNSGFGTADHQNGGYVSGGDSTRAITPRITQPGGGQPAIAWSLWYDGSLGGTRVGSGSNGLGFSGTTIYTWNGEYTVEGWESAPLKDL